MKPVEESVIQGRLLSGFFFLHTRAFLCGFNIFRRDQAKNTPFYCSGLLGKKAIPTTVLTHIHKYIYIDMFSYIFPLHHDCICPPFKPKRLSPEMVLR